MAANLHRHSDLEITLRRSKKKQKPYFSLLMLCIKVMTSKNKLGRKQCQSLGIGQRLWRWAKFLVFILASS
jgi:hypothetical protein